MRGRYWIVRGLDTACRVVDDVAYRPAVVRLTMRLPRWWRCELARLAGRLDERWGTGYFGEWAPPDGVCDICGRRAAWLVIGGPDEDADPPDAGDYLARHPLHVCSWCKLTPDGPITSRGDLDLALARSRAKSITWRWRWRPI